MAAAAGPDEEARLADAAGAETPPMEPPPSRAGGGDERPGAPGPRSGAASPPLGSPRAQEASGGGALPLEAGAPERPPQQEGAASPSAEGGGCTGQANSDGERNDISPTPADSRILSAAGSEEGDAPRGAAAPPLPDLEMGGPGSGARGAAEAPEACGAPAGGLASPEGLSVQEADFPGAARASEAGAGDGPPTPSLPEAGGPAEGPASASRAASSAGGGGGGSPCASPAGERGGASPGRSSAGTPPRSPAPERSSRSTARPAVVEACSPEGGEAALDCDAPRDSGYLSPCSDDERPADEEASLGAERGHASPTSADARIRITEGSAEALFEHLSLNMQLSAPPPRAARTGLERNSFDSSVSADFKVVTREVTGTHSEVSACESEPPPSPEEAVANSPRLFQARGLGPRMWPRTWPAELAADLVVLGGGFRPHAQSPGVLHGAEDPDAAALPASRRAAPPPREDPPASRREARPAREDGSPGSGSAPCPRSPPLPRPLSCPPGLGSGAPSDRLRHRGGTDAQGERRPSSDGAPRGDRVCSEDSESALSVGGDKESVVTPPRSFVTRRGDSTYTSGGASSSSSGVPPGSACGRRQVVTARSRDPLAADAVYQVLRGSSRALNSWLGDLSGLSSEALERAHRVQKDTLERWQDDMPSWSDMERWQGELSACADKQAKALQDVLDERVRWALRNWDLNREKAKARLLDISRPARETMLGSMKDMIKSSALGDPDMWSWAKDCIEACLSKVLDDLEHEIEVNIEAALLKQRQQDELEGPCADRRASWYKRFPVMLYFQVRRFVLYHYLPHNRSIYGKVYDPVYVAILLLTLAPVPFVRVIFFTVLLSMIVIPGPPDEFQLVNFILLFKGTQFLNALSTMAKGSMEYFVCFSARKDALLPCIERNGPGGNEQLLSGLMDYLGSCVLVWIAFRLLPYSRKAVQTRFVGRHDEEVPAESDEEQDEPEFETCCFGRCRYRLIKTKGGRLGQLLKWDVKAFVLSNVALVALAIWTSRLDPDFAQRGAAEWLHHSPQFKQDLFWCKVLYGLLSLPFLPFSISFLCKVLTHCEWTGFNEKGACVAFEVEPRPYYSRRTRSTPSWRHRLRKAVGRCGRSRAPVPEGT